MRVLRIYILKCLIHIKITWPISKLVLEAPEKKLGQSVPVCTLDSDFQSPPPTHRGPQEQPKQLFNWENMVTLLWSPSPHLLRADQYLAHPGLW